MQSRLKIECHCLVELKLKWRRGSLNFHGTKFGKRKVQLRLRSYRFQHAIIRFPSGSTNLHCLRVNVISWQNLIWWNQNSTLVITERNALTENQFFISHLPAMVYPLGIRLLLLLLRVCLYLINADWFRFRQSFTRRYGIQEVNPMKYIE